MIVINTDDAFSCFWSPLVLSKALVALKSVNVYSKAFSSDKLNIIININIIIIIIIITVNTSKCGITDINTQLKRISQLSQGNTASSNFFDLQATTNNDDDYSQFRGSSTKTAGRWQCFCWQSRTRTDGPLVFPGRPWQDFQVRRLLRPLS